MGQRGPLRIINPDDDPLLGTAQKDVAQTPGVSPLYRPKRIRDNQILNDMWTEMIVPLENQGLLTQFDVPAIEMVLRHFRAFVAIDDSWAERDYDMVEYTDKGVPMKNPIASEHRAQSELFLKFAGQLGMTFGSRARTPGKDDNGSSGSGNPFSAAI